MAKNQLDTFSSWHTDFFFATTSFFPIFHYFELDITKNLKFTKVTLIPHTYIVRYVNQYFLKWYSTLTSKLCPLNSQPFKPIIQIFLRLLPLAFTQIHRLQFCPPCTYVFPILSQWLFSGSYDLFIVPSCFIALIVSFYCEMFLDVLILN